MIQCFKIRQSGKCINKRVTNTFYNLNKYSLQFGQKQSLPGLVLLTEIQQSALIWLKDRGRQKLLFSQLQHLCTHWPSHKWTRSLSKNSVWQICCNLQCFDDLVVSVARKWKFFISFGLPGSIYMNSIHGINDFRPCLGDWLLGEFMF